MKKIKSIVTPIIILVLIVVILSVSKRPEYLGGLFDTIISFFDKNEFVDSYNAKSMLLLDLSNNEDFVSKNVEEKQTPASLAKLFVIEYANTLTNLNDVVVVDRNALQFVKSGSSKANIKSEKYYLKNLYAALLVPSGNDAAYVLADYCGGILNKNAKSSEERIDVFIQNLNKYLKQNGYNDTVLYDPSGYDYESKTTVLDLSKVTKSLLKKDWFREIISKPVYTIKMPNGKEQTWKNTNDFLDPTFDYYNKNVIGVKTGSLENDYNLVVLYKMHGKEFLICSLGSQSDTSRYDDVNYILNTINNSDYLKK